MHEAADLLLWLGTNEMAVDDDGDSPGNKLDLPVDGQSTTPTAFTRRGWARSCTDGSCSRWQGVAMPGLAGDAPPLKRKQEEGSKDPEYL